MNVTIIMH